MPRKQHMGNKPPRRNSPSTIKRNTWINDTDPLQLIRMPPTAGNEILLDVRKVDNTLGVTIAPSLPATARSLIALGILPR
ncbi:hypothetical protein PENARI_c015G09746 [Penicillium arizonense]|uniref:Uncharacterized protein n=1 Tax=Penicillium arizonense TaxID=1835702 RepID=A0A1F5LC43_PENAI|nr:hypothetical protein PENARI_c015G09746 [Penicillium arizonense]OGE50798.1 hypothetical protein PENARI_c015G09746 [Penicillium arizonense]